MRDAIIELVAAHNAYNSEEQKRKEVTLGFLNENVNCAKASNLSGHITASARVLSPDGTQVLLTHHRKLDRWLQLGGHVEDDATIQNAALREAIEESGIGRIELIRDSIFDIDVHVIPLRKTVPEHLHYDLRFLMRAETTNVQTSAESNALAWVTLEDARELVTDASIIRMVEKTVTDQG